MTRAHLVTVAVLLLMAGGCAAGGASTAGVPADPGAAATVTVGRGTVVDTVVIPATVRADAGVTVTAPAAGRYTRSGNGFGYVLDSGRSGRLALPAGVEIAGPTVAPGRHVPADFPLARARVDGFALVAQLDAATAYRLYTLPRGARGQITDGPGPFDCALADPVPEPVSGSDPPAMSLTCVVPGNLAVFAGMPGVMAVTTAVATSVLTLPVEAVAGSAQQGQVWLVDAAGQRHLRTVTLGITDGVQIQIVSGVREGDTVALPAPDLSGGSS